jgi:hypothetical protein
MIVERMMKTHIQKSGLCSDCQGEKDSVINPNWQISHNTDEFERVRNFISLFLFVWSFYSIRLVFQTCCSVQREAAVGLRDDSGDFHLENCLRIVYGLVRVRSTEFQPENFIDRFYASVGFSWTLIMNSVNDLTGRWDCWYARECNGMKASERAWRMDIQIRQLSTKCNEELRQFYVIL